MDRRHMSQPMRRQTTPTTLLFPLAAMTLLSAALGCGGSEEPEQTPSFVATGGAPAGGATVSGGTSSGGANGGTAGSGGKPSPTGGTGGAGSGGVGIGGTGGTGSGGATTGPDGCFKFPKTHLEIINACTDAVKISKQPTLTGLLPNGDLPPLP